MLRAKELKDILERIRSNLDTAFAERLRGVLLHGSRAREEAEQTSDLDLLVLLEEPVKLGQDLETIVQALYPIQLELDYPIHALPVSFKVFEAGLYAIHRNAKREGVLL